MEDESVKVNCQIWDCKFNLWIRTKKSACKLKYIDISVGMVSDYPHGINGVCQNMELKNPRKEEK